MGAETVLRTRSIHVSEVRFSRVVSDPKGSVLVHVRRPCSGIESLPAF